MLIRLIMFKFNRESILILIYNQDHHQGHQGHQGRLIPLAVVPILIMLPHGGIGQSSKMS